VSLVIPYTTLFRSCRIGEVEVARGQAAVSVAEADRAPEPLACDTRLLRHQGGATEGKNTKRAEEPKYRTHRASWPVGECPQSERGGRKGKSGTLERGTPAALTDARLVHI